MKNRIKKVYLKEPKTTYQFKTIIRLNQFEKN